MSSGISASSEARSHESEWAVFCQPLIKSTPLSWDVDNGHNSSRLFSVVPIAMLDSLSDALAERAAQPCPDYVVYATDSIALVILYLVDVPNTRLIRIGLWPLGVFFAGWLILTIKRDAGGLHPSEAEDMLMVG